MRLAGFAIPLLLPLMLVASTLAGGAWTFAPFVFIFGVVPLLDLVTGRDTWNPEPQDVEVLESQRSYQWLLYAWLPLQFGMLAWLLHHVGTQPVSLFEWSGIALSAGTVTGGIGITVAHELGHKLDRREQWLARLLLMSVCYTHFHVEHNKGHHARVATPHDPASAREGQSLYAFLPQTLLGSARSAWRFERERLAKQGHGTFHWHNQVLWGIGGSLLMLCVASMLGGVAAAALFLLQSVVAILLLEIVNYIEHYGLRRAPRESGGYERVDVVHSWNASERFTNWFLFNLQRHSHHHVEHHRRYQVLRHVERSPQLPTGYAGMVLVALLPPLWRHVMDARLQSWRSRADQ